MADLKISQLTGATTPLAGTEVVPLVQGSATKKVAVSDLTAGRAVSMATATTSGNAAVGTSLVAWNSNYTALDVGGVAGVTSYLYTDAWFNCYVNAGGTVVYKNGGYPASRLRLDGTLKWSSTGTTTGSAGGTATLVDYLSVDATGNITPLVAAKGINFTANTPAAGMTSQLLNWYEEGTWTPTVTSSSGSITTVTASGTYTRVGRLVTATFTYNITNAGTGSGVVRVTSPFASRAAALYPTGSVAEVAVAGWGGYCIIDQGTSTITVQKYDGGYAGNVNVVVRGTITYEA